MKIKAQDYRERNVFSFYPKKEKEIFYNHRKTIQVKND
jgi:hypothetical protein